MTVLPSCVAALNVLPGKPFYDSCSSVSDLVDTVTEYMNFCVDTILPKKCVNIYPNEKPWVTKEVKKLLKAKQYAFWTGDNISLKIAQAELKACVRKCKEDYKNKIQAQFKQNNTKQALHSVTSNQSNRRNAALRQTPPNLLTI